MGAVIRFLVSAPLAALVTVVIFLTLYNQLSPKPFLYVTDEEDGKIYLGEQVLCTCRPPRPIIDIFFRIVPADTDNPWTNSEKPVKEAPTLHGGETPAQTTEIDTARHDNLRFCSDERPLLDFVAPPYPERCVKKAAEGRVTIRFDITKEGQPINVVILQSPDNCFNAPVIASIERRRYPPYCTPDGKPAMKTGVTETFTFMLEDRQSF